MLIKPAKKNSVGVKRKAGKHLSSVSELRCLTLLDSVRRFNYMHVNVD